MDPCLDISLGLGPGQNSLASCLKRCVVPGSGMIPRESHYAKHRFTQSESLSVKDWSCQKCGKVSHEANKRLSMKRLPPVLSVQFKVSGLPDFTKILFDGYGTALRAARNGHVQDRHSRASTLLD